VRAFVWLTGLQSGDAQRTGRAFNNGPSGASVTTAWTYPGSGAVVGSAVVQSNGSSPSVACVCVCVKLLSCTAAAECEWMPRSSC
jgi:hypothetical protein